MKSKRYDAWRRNAEIVRNDFGGYVDDHELFYICPECGEPIYVDDWTADDFECTICPICEFSGED